MNQAAQAHEAGTRRAVPAAWVLALVSVLLLISSFTGEGNGLFGTGVLRDGGWSFVLPLIGGVAIVVLLLLATAGDG